MLAKQLVLSCVYLPCHSAGTDYEVELSSVLARLEGTLDKYSDCVHIVAGDYNFECSASHKRYNMFSDLVSTYNLECMDNEQDDCGYTFFHETFGYKSWIDHVFPSYPLHKWLTNFKIVDSGCYNGDHNPTISWSLNWGSFREANSVPIVKNVQQHRRTYQMCWDKADFVLYYSLTGEALQRIEIPKHVLFQSGNGEDHIELYYNNIVQALCSAGNMTVPRIPIVP